MTEWFFPKLSGGEEQGLNDAGVETFKKQDSLARETCQNIGDVWDHECGEPAIATFELVHLPTAEFPGRDKLIELFEACRDYVLEGLPDGFYDLKNLKIADLYFNNIQKVSPAIGKKKNTH